jgi:hypothetical protein
MGEKAKMRYLLLSLLVVAGCAQKVQPPPPPPPMPSIEVEEHETNGGVMIRVIYLNHNSYNNVANVSLEKLDSLRNYKKEVEFLLKRIEETEQKMSIHEDQPKTKVP